jgi:diadenosine tetraphosphatase ApaH/serine/threonine PP2A family protein phosphatase
MRFAAIADIHGNCLALEAVLADIEASGIMDVVNLGDHVSGPLEAARTADVLMSCDFPSIQGDQDRRLVQLDRSGRPSKRMDFNQLDRRHLDWLASHPLTLLYRDEVFLCHGSPEDDTAYWLDHVMSDGGIQLAPIEQIAAAASGITASLILCGHTHVPRAVRLLDGRMVVNPGSVGLPGYDGSSPVYHRVEAGTPDACYAICELKHGRWQVSFRHVPYDHAAMADMARQNGMPLWASALATGWVR